MIFKCLNSSLNGCQSNGRNVQTFETSKASSLGPSIDAIDNAQRTLKAIRDLPRHPLQIWNSEKNTSWICLGFVWSDYRRDENLKLDPTPSKPSETTETREALYSGQCHCALALTLRARGGRVTEGFSALFWIMLLGPSLCLFTPENISSMVRFSCFAIFCWLWLLWIYILWLLSLLLWSCQNLFNFKIVRVCQHCVSSEVAKSRLIVTALRAPWASCKGIKPEIRIGFVRLLYNSLQHGTGEAGRLRGIWIGDFACERY